MRDPYDKLTRDFVPKGETVKYIASIGYTTAASNKIRSTTILIDAKDVAEAKKLANEQASKEFDWYKLNAVKPA